MQSAAMGETLYLAFFIWALVYLREFLQGDGKALTKCGLCVAAACLTRYDGWFLAAAIVVVALIASSRLGEESKNAAPRPLTANVRTAIVKFVLIAAAAPLFW